MALILGIDPGSRVTGYGIVNDLGQTMEYVDSGCIRLSSRDALAERLVDIFNGLSEIIETRSPQEVAIEEVFMSRNADSALKLGQARGVAIVAARIRKLQVYEYAARQIKQSVVGTGAASKDQITHMVRILLKLPGNPQQDAADALAIAICHINTSRGLKQVTGAVRGSSGQVRPGSFSRGRFTTGKQIE